MMRVLVSKGQITVDAGHCGIQATEIFSTGIVL